MCLVHSSLLYKTARRILSSGTRLYVLKDIQIIQNRLTLFSLLRFYGCQPFCQFRVFRFPRLNLCVLFTDLLTLRLNGSRHIRFAGGNAFIQREGHTGVDHVLTVAHAAAHAEHHLVGGTVEHS